MSRILNAKRAKYPYHNDLDCVAQVVGARVKVDACADPLTGFFNDRAASLGTQVATLMPSRFFWGGGPPNRSPPGRALRSLGFGCWSRACGADGPTGLAIWTIADLNA